jgi:hypothetical protein
MPLLICGQALQHSRNPDVVKGTFMKSSHVRLVLPPEQSRKASKSCSRSPMLAFVVARLALDVWIWVPRLGH